MGGKPETCKWCYLPPGKSPKIERKSGDHIWICPICGNESEKQFEKPKSKPMTEVLETK